MLNSGKKEKEKGKQPKNPSQHKTTHTLLEILAKILSRRNRMVSLLIQQRYKKLLFKSIINVGTCNIETGMLT